MVSSTNNLIQDLVNVGEAMAAAHYTYDHYIKKLATLYSRVISGKITREEMKSDMIKINEIFAIFNKYTEHFGGNVNILNEKLTPQIVKILQTPKPTVAFLMEDVIKLADAFDESGDCKNANRVDNFIKNASNDIGNLVSLLVDKNDRNFFISEVVKLANFSDEIGAHILANELDKIASNPNEFIQLNESNLSTRYCPDHRGTQAIRISENIYQCPIDGKIYNYEVGYTNYKGQKIPGGSIAAQTPTTTDFGGIPMRIYDSRQNILNSIN